MKKIFFLSIIIIFSYSVTLFYSKGWSLKSLSIKNEVNVSVFNALILWSYKDGNWSVYSSDKNLKNIIGKAGFNILTSIKSGEGFWIYSEKNDSVELNGTKYDITYEINFSQLKHGWYLLGTGKNILVSDLLNQSKNINLIWKYNNGKWLGFSSNKVKNEFIKSKFESLTEINASEGFWVYINDENVTDNISFDENITTIEEALKYLNYLRNCAGMISLSLNDNLNKAALNHSNYMKINNIFSHSENENNSSFTGITPNDRAIYAGYLSRYVLENISSGNNSYKDSIDGLFSAIYHRLGFLNININEIGIGKDDKFYTYDMGNSNLNNLCASDSFNDDGYYYTNVCADKIKKVSVIDYNNAIESVEKLNPKIIIWPAKDSKNIPPVFYEEIPDPLPDNSVSGYPVSITFNKYYFKTPPKLISFKIYDDNGEITDTKLLDKNSDVNNKIDEFSYVLFPLKRLDWNKKYKVKVVYDLNETEKTIEWNFTTKKLNYPYYKVEGTNANLNVLVGKTYAVYFLPQNNNDLLGSTQCSFSTNVKFKYGFIDQNTIYIQLIGKKGETANCSFSNGDKIKLTISDTDFLNKTD